MFIKIKSVVERCPLVLLLWHVCESGAVFVFAEFLYIFLSTYIFICLKTTHQLYWITLLIKSIETRLCPCRPQPAGPPLPFKIMLHRHSVILKPTYKMILNGERSMVVAYKINPV